MLARPLHKSLSALIAAGVLLLTAAPVIGFIETPHKVYAAPSNLSGIPRVTASKLVSALGDSGSATAAGAAAASAGQVMDDTAAANDTTAAMDAFSGMGKGQQGAIASLVAAQRKADEERIAAAIAKIHNTQLAKIVADASKYVDIVPYVFGGSTPAGWDCSGFTAYVYNETLGIDLPHSVIAQHALGKEISQADAQPGDLVVFSSKKETDFHVGIYIGDGLMINAPQPGELTKIGNVNWDPTNTVTYVDVLNLLPGSTTN